MTPLSGLKVIDLTKVLAGPLCAQYLGELGADVIKIEPPGTGDDTRAWLPQRSGQSAMFLAVNHNKRSLALDLKTDAGRAIVHRLAAGADIVLQGFGGGTARKLQVDRETLSAINPRLIYCEISGYGRNGPLGGEPGYDVMLQAFSGMLSTMGQPGALARASFSPIDLGTGMSACAGILAAVIERQQTGRGVSVELSLFDSAMAFMGYIAQSYWMTGKDPQPMGTAHAAMCPYQAFEAADGLLMLGVGNDAHWRRFCAVADLEAYRDDPRFATNAARASNRNDTVELTAARIRTRTVASWLELLRGCGVPCSPINTLGQALAEPQLEARALVASSEHPLLGTVKNMGMPIQFDQQPRVVRRPAPLLGEHTREILQELGLPEGEIASLLEAGVVSTA